MKVSWTSVALLLFLWGCDSCERPQEHPATGGGAAAPKQVATATVGTAPLPPTAQGAAGMPVPPAAGTTPGVGAEAGAEDGDCIVIGDASPDYGAPPLEVEFSAEAECSSGQPKYRWDFGDGSSSDDPNATHTYTKAGEYTAIVTVTGADGSTSTDEIDVTVEEEAADLE